MEHAQKMYLVDKRQLDSLTPAAPVVKDIRSTATLRLDAEMLDVLNRPGLADHDKAALYSGILQKYLNHVRQGDLEKTQLTLHLPTPTDSGAPPVQAPDPVVTDVLATLTPGYRPNAEVVLHRMGLQKDVASWNDRGEFIHRGNIVRGSNMYDLLKALTQRRHTAPANAPNGWGEFTRAIADLNIPTSVAGNIDTRRRLETLKAPPAPTPPATPRQPTPPSPPQPSPDEIWRARGFNTSRPSTTRYYDGADVYDASNAYANVKRAVRERQGWLPY